MERRWLVAVLALILVAGGILLSQGCSNREPEASFVAEEGSPNVVDPTATVVPSTATRKPGPSVLQATRAATATAAPTETTAPTVAPTTTPLPSPTEEQPPTPTAPPDPTATPEPAASPTIEAAGTDWLQFVNLFRREANLPLLREETSWSLDAALHSRYMVMTGDLRHNQDPASPFSTRGGQTAAENGNIAAGYIGSDPYEWAFNYWMSAPFHAIPILDPQLAATGFAEYRDAAGVTTVAATLDVRRGLGGLPAEVEYPVMFPRNDGITWVLRYSLPEFPEALSTCVGYQQPTGAPIILQIGSGGAVPNVTGTALYRDGEYLAHCHFDETNYNHPDAYRQKSARTILDQRDAIVIIPQQPLLPDSTYAVRVDANGQTYTWSFRTVAGPP